MMFTCKSGKAFKVLNQHFETLHTIFFSRDICDTDKNPVSDCS
jgi:hypothetical protein